MGYVQGCRLYVYQKIGNAQAGQSFVRCGMVYFVVERGSNKYETLLYFLTKFVYSVQLFALFNKKIVFVGFVE